MAQGLRANAAPAEGHGFGSQHPCGGSQLSVTPVAGDPTPSSDLSKASGMLTADKQTYGQNTHMCNISAVLKIQKGEKIVLSVYNLKSHFILRKGKWRCSSVVQPGFNICGIGLDSLVSEHSPEMGSGEGTSECF